MNDQRIRVLLIEDNPGDALLIRQALIDADHGSFELERADRLSTGLQRLGQRRFDCVLLDLGLPDSWGLDTLGSVRAKAPNVPTVVLTGVDDEDLAVTAAREGAQDYLVKGQVDGATVARGVRYAIERKRAEQAVRRSEERLRLLLENISDVVLVLDREYVIRYASASCIRMLGSRPEALTGQSLGAFVHEDDAPRVADFFASGTQGAVDFRLRAHGDQWLQVEAVATNLLHHPEVGGMVMTIRDITERRKLESHVLQSQKIDSVGRLAGGIAHDFNNLLTGILSYCQLALMAAPAGSPVHEYLQVIERAGQRASGLTRQLLAFSRRQNLESKLVQVNELILSMDKLLQRLIGETITLETVPSQDLCLVRADPGQIEQVILNLAINARDAMPDGGKLTIETANVHLDADYARQHPGVHAGHYVMITVSDTGVGMDEQVKAHLFEPFFTTKETGKGTGLGLATSHGIIKQSGGHITVRSEKGHGTTVKVYLPRAREAGQAEAQDRMASEPPRGVETVLVAEDDETVREVVVQALRNLGYEVLEASDGERAMEIAERHKGSIDLLLTDVVMPGMGGPVLAQELRRIRPKTRVLFMSGYASNAFFRQGVEPVGSGVGLINKPFTPQTLGEKVREVLDK